MLAGKLAAEVVTDRALGRPTQGVKAAPQDAVARAEATRRAPPQDRPLGREGGG